MKFTLKIKLGNAAMQSGYDIAGALREVAEKVEGIGYDDITEADPYDRSGKIRDLNGNTVGSWEVTA